MIRVSNNYKQQMLKPVRNRGYASVSLGVVNQEAQKDAKIVGSKMYYSQGNVFAELREGVTYATMEQDFFVCDGSYLFPPDIDGVLSDVTGVGVSNETLILHSDNLNVYARENGVVSTNLLGSIKIKLGKTYNIKGLTIDFGNSFPTKFKVQSAAYTRTYSDNYNTRWDTEDLFGETDYFIITPITMVGGQQRLHIKQIILGVGLSFTNETSSEVSAEDFISDISAEVSYKNFKATVFDEQGRFDVDNDESFMTFLEPGQRFTINYGIELDNGNIEWHQKGVGYLKDWSLKKRTLTLNGTDRLALYKTKYTKGNKIYTRTAYAECLKIFNDLGLEPDEYHIDTYLQNISLSNPMPELTHRECLQLLCNATRCVCFEDNEGIIQIKGNFATVLDPENIDIQTSNKTAWSKPQNVFAEVNAQYADMSYNMGNTDGTVYYLPTNSNYLETGYVSNSISKADGTFDTNPYIDVVLPATFSYFGVNVNFGDVVPEEVKLTAFLDDEIVDEYTETNIEQESTFLDEFSEFNILRIEIVKTHANSRCLINKVSFGDASDFKLTSDLMTENPDVYKDSRIKDIWVKVYSFTNDEDGKPKETEDANYVVATLDTDGDSKYCENQLISTQAQAETLANWLTSHYKNNVSYSVSYRGDPKLEAGDIIGLESEYVNNLQVAIESANISFNGGFKGTLELRRYIQREPEELNYVELPVNSSSITTRVDNLEDNVSDVEDRVDTIESGYLKLAGGTMTGSVRGNSGAIFSGAYAIQATTVPDAINEIKYKNGCFGSVCITTAYTANNATIPVSWYNYLWLPHRTGGTGTGGNGDNQDYGSLYLNVMTSRSTQFFIVNYMNPNIYVSRFASTN